MKKRRGPARRRGVTFVELVMVMGITGVFAAIALPRYSGAVARYRAEVAAKRIVADLGVAQARARQLSTSQTITFTPASNQYQIVGMTDPDRSTATYTVTLSDSPYRTTLVSASLGGDTSLIFNGYGMPDSGGTIVVQAGTVIK